jgi:hypothetical protein
VDEALRDRRERAGRNQSMWREINELALTKRQEDPTFTSFVCECAAETCTEEVTLTREEYEAIRKDPNRFFVKPGHVFPEVDRVIGNAGAEGGRYEIVEKIGEGAHVAHHHDPRNGS